MTRPEVAYDIVVPTVGRPSLATLLAAVAAGEGPLPGRIVLVDDRRDRRRPLLADPPPASLAARVRVVEGHAAGPATARDLGWRRTTAPWVVFIDDDVVPDPGWRARLADDLAAAGPGVAGSQARLRVPLPTDRRPTDWERDVAGLADAPWITADMAYRRLALRSVDGFDRRFPRAYREDTDIALRVRAAGWELVRGERTVCHPVRPADRWASVRRQAGNADDARLLVRHGLDWRRRAGAGPGRRRRHAAVVGAGTAALLAAATGRPKVAAALGLAWLAGTAELAWARVAPGPRTPTEVATMAATSVAIPPSALLWWVRGLVEAVGDEVRELRRPLLPDAADTGVTGSSSAPVALVLFDRDGTLVDDVPYNGDPSLVRPRPGAREAVRRLRDRGVRVGVVTNQSGIARGSLRPDQVDAVNRRVDELVGPFDVWQVCPHGPDDGCGCRKPEPGMVRAAAARLGVDPQRCVVVGDIGADVGAAAAAGARGILVPTPVTRAEEVAAAPEVAWSLIEAAALVLGGEPDELSPRVGVLVRSGGDGR